MIVSRTIREHERIWREGAIGVPANAPTLPTQAFEALARSEERRADSDGALFLLGRNNLKAQSWVGVVRAQNVQIEILPKTMNGQVDDDRMNLLEMLRYAEELPIRERDVAALSARHAPIDDLLVELFAKRLERELIQGPDRAYTQREENLHALRGRLHIPRHVVVNAAHRERFWCRFDELNLDTPVSRGLKAVARHLARHTRSERARQSLDRSLLLLDEVADVVEVAELLDGIRLHRQNERFADLVTFARLVATNMNPSFRAGDLQTFSLLFPMERVFESFLAGFLKREVLPEGGSLRLRQQGKGHRPALLRSRDSGADVLTLKPDLLFEQDGQAVLVADTKWKLLREKRRAQGVAEADFYQLHAYLSRYGSTRGLLLYPKSTGAADESLDFLDTSDAPSGSSIAIRSVNIARNLRKASERAALKSELKAILCEALDGTPAETAFSTNNLGHEALV